MKENFIVEGEVIEVNYKSDNTDHKNNIKVKLYPKNNEFSDIITAKPLFPTMNISPIKGEIVLLLKTLNAYSSFYRRLYEYYYFSIVNLHNNVNNNILANASDLDNVSNSFGRLSRIQDAVSGVQENSVLNNITFSEKYVPTLQQFEGDISYVGRWGNHIKFTRSKSDYSNTNNSIISWDTSTDENDPLLTLINGYSNNNDNYVENINQDDSSIYLTSTQKIYIDISNTKKESFENPPTEENKYTDPQIIVNSNRILLNSLDNTILSGKNYINLSTKEIHLNSDNKTIVDSPKIYLGSKDATEPIVLGNKNEDWLKELLGTLKDILSSLANHTHASPVGPTGMPLPPALNDFTTTHVNKLTDYINSLPDNKSENNFSL